MIARHGSFARATEHRAGARSGMTPIEDLAAADFEPLIGSPFHVVPAPGVAVDLVLFEVQRLTDERRTPTGAARPGMPAFSLCWYGPVQPFLPQRIYRLEHPVIGPVELFLVPLGPDAVGMRYQAVLY
jgi:hypothetical protein